MAGRYTNRDVRGRFVSTRNIRESGNGKFATYTDMPVKAEGADPADLAYKMVGRDDSNAGPRYDAPKVADNFGVGGSRLRARNPSLVPDDEQAATIYGAHVQGQVGRVAASRGSRDRIAGTDVEQDLSRRLTGAV